MYPDMLLSTSSPGKTYLLAHPDSLVTTIIIACVCTKPTDDLRIDPSVSAEHRMCSVPELTRCEERLAVVTIIERVK